ncbi:MAG: aminoacyl-tRNA hydrolase [Rhizobiaceae bacterium]|nr:aminoacyl-tRNA hydrolase [Rhizobiaceae bacterium]
MPADTLHIDDAIAIAGWELTENFVLASGPGGQNVNKVATAVELRFDLIHSPSLPERVKHNARRVFGRRLTKDGVVVILADKFRSQDRNREDARERLKALILEANQPPPPPRKKTRPTRGSIERRLKAKAGRSEVKKGRGKVEED